MSVLGFGLYFVVDRLETYPVSLAKFKINILQNLAVMFFEKT